MLEQAIRVIRGDGYRALARGSHRAMEDGGQNRCRATGAWAVTVNGALRALPHRSRLRRA